MDLEHLLRWPTLKGTTWTIRVRRSGEVGTSLELAPNTLLRTASVGKLFVLVEVADAIHAGALDPQQVVARNVTDPVLDAGL